MPNSDAGSANVNRVRNPAGFVEAQPRYGASCYP
jgi:hypothetical protein